MVWVNGRSCAEAQPPAWSSASGPPVMTRPWWPSMRTFSSSTSPVSECRVTMSTLAPAFAGPSAGASGTVETVTAGARSVNSKVEPWPGVLLAEDNPFNQKVATAMLKLIGCRVQVAANGVEAVTMAREGVFDLVLMDCQMPAMDGYEATRRIRELPSPAGAVTIIAMTANALSGDRKACFASGMDDFLSKPITKAMLSDMMNKWEIVGKTPEPVVAPVH